MQLHVGTPRDMTPSSLAGFRGKLALHCLSRPVLVFSWTEVALRLRVIVRKRKRSDEDAMLLARRESRADFPEVFVQLLDPLGMEIDGVRWFLSRGKHKSSQSTFNVVCCSLCRKSLSAWTPHDPFGQFCAGARSAKDVQFFYIAFSLASNFCVWFQGRFLSCRSGGYVRSCFFSDKGSRALTVSITRANNFFMFLHSA